MIEQLPSPSDKVLGFRLSGKLRDEDYKTFVPAIDEAAQAGKVRLLAQFHDFQGWDAEVAAKAGVDDVARLPRIVVGTEPVGRVHDAGGAPLGGGTIDALAEQFVAGADSDGDVLVILGSTLIVWAVLPEWREAAGVWTVPHTAPGKSLIGGPSNAASASARSAFQAGPEAGSAAISAGEIQIQTVSGCSA